MSSRSLKLRFTLVLALALVLGAIPLMGASAVVGSVAGTTNATVGGQVLVPNTTVFSGDNLRVNDGAAVVAMGMGSRMVFGRDTQVTFQRGPNEVTVELSQGVVSMYHPVEGLPMRVKVGSVAVSSGSGFKTLGDVAMINGTIVITSKEGTLHVDGAGSTTEVAKGKTIAITPNPEGTPQGAGTAAHHWTQAQIINVVSLASAGAGLGFSIADYKKTNDVQTTANQANSAASAAAASSALAASAAEAAEAAAVAACKAASPNNPAC